MSADEPLLPFESVKISSFENPDWAYARNLRSVLMSTSAEWVQSCSSCRIRADGSEFVAPNRDYPYEGLSVVLDGENWKFVDAVGVGLRTREGRNLELDSRRQEADVEVNPWEIRYHYTTVNVEPSDPFANLRVSVAYRLHSAGDPLQATTGEVRVRFPELPEALRSQLVITFLPLIDIRHMFSPGNFGGYQTSATDTTRITLRSYNRRLTVQASRGNVIPLQQPVILQWWYKLGSGQRFETVDTSGRPITQFTPEGKDVAAFFKVECDTRDEPAAVLYFHCSIEGAGQAPSLEECERNSRQSWRRDCQEAAEIERVFSFSVEPEVRTAILGRIAGVKRFRVAVSYDNGKVAHIPAAGAWWFKTPWFRDTFEGILNSFRVLMTLPEERRNIGEVILAALSSQHPETGLIPNRFPNHKGDPALYNSADATLLCLIASARYCSETKNGGVAAAAVSTLVRLLKMLSRSADAIDDGPPRIDAETGLLLSTPHHSWIDTRSLSMSYAGQNMKDLPSRVSPQFVKDLCDYAIPAREVVAYLSTPRFFLPEINAQWILMLRGVLSDLIPLIEQDSAGSALTSEEIKNCADQASALLQRATDNFLHVFWNDDGSCLYNVVFEDRKIVDRVESETSITAAAMLGRAIFSEDELHTIWRTVKKKLLAYRTITQIGGSRQGNEAPQPFGVITKNVDCRIYYNDGQYHVDVIWPRSVPYLVRLLTLLDERAVARAIVLNNLDHQMSEGAMFYNHELLSRPSGNNPAPASLTRHNPVPVKNAIQFWSQWCDPILDLFGPG